ncbi:MAG TPA: M23 family peptidase [Spirochaeta sp.]|nr:M23 family peptidase [Spirochaeta sp.]
MIKKAILVFLFFTAAVAVFSFSIYAPESAVQGGVITLVIEEGCVYEDINVELARGDETYSKTNVFETEISEYEVDIALLGVPSTLKPGVYSIYAADEDGERYRRDIIIKAKEFINEDIPLSRSMSDLRQSDDVKKAEQWRNLLVILRTVDREHIYEERNLAIPVSDYLRTSSFYGDRRRFLYDDGTTARSIHNGIDYSAEIGTPVYSAGRGRVVFSGDRIISGNTVVIEHLPGVYSLYYHMNSRSVSEDDMVDSGQQLGTVGSTGLATGAHLHWEIRVAGVAVDPVPLMRGDIIDKAFILSTIDEQ